jgi:integrase
VSTRSEGKRDRAILSVLLYHGLRREELATLRVRDIHPRRGVLHLRAHRREGAVSAPAPRDGGVRHPRATAATNALARVQEWLGHANIATTRLYDRVR